MTSTGTCVSSDRLKIREHRELQFKTHVVKHELLVYMCFSLQSGCAPDRARHSCQTALVKLLDDWLTAIDNNEIVGTLFLDLSIAFDLVNHDIL